MARKVRRDNLLRDDRFVTLFEVYLYRGAKVFVLEHEKAFRTLADAERFVKRAVTAGTYESGHIYEKRARVRYIAERGD